MPFRHRTRVKSILAVAGNLLAGLLWAQSAGAQSPSRAETFALKLDGDLGMGAYYTRSVIRDKSEPASILPYANFDYGRMFARIDTFGIKTVKIASGYLELAGRVELDGFKADTPGLRGLNDRRDSVPLGFSTLQETPVGAWYATALHDFGKSSGNLVDVTYVARLATGRLTMYPQAGVEYLSSRYVGYYYGVSTPEAATNRYRYYKPGGALDPYLAALVEVRISEKWNFNFLVRHKWLANSIADSPLVTRHGVNNVFASFAYRFM